MLTEALAEASPELKTFPGRSAHGNIPAQPPGHRQPWMIRGRVSEHVAHESDPLSRGAV